MWLIRDQTTAQLPSMHALSACLTIWLCVCLFLNLQDLLDKSTPAWPLHVSGRGITRLHLKDDNTLWTGTSGDSLIHYKSERRRRKRRAVETFNGHLLSQGRAPSLGMEQGEYQEAERHLVCLRSKAHFETPCGFLALPPPLTPKYGLSVF